MSRSFSVLVIWIIAVILYHIMLLHIFHYYMSVNKTRLSGHMYYDGVGLMGGVDMENIAETESICSCTRDVME